MADAVLGRRRTMQALAALGVAGAVRPAGAVVRGGTMIVALEGEPTSLVPFLSTDITAIMVAANIFNGLVSLDFDFKPTPDLAKSWDVSGDGLTYIFELEPAAKWHDGKPVTAEDAAFSFNEIIAKAHPRAGSWWPNVEHAKAVGPHSFEIRLKEAYAPFLTLVGSLSGNGTGIMPKHVYAGSDPRSNPANLRPVGSGPFRFVRWDRGGFVELARNTAYFKPGLPHLDRLVFQITPDASARLLAFERGEVDFLHSYIVPYEAVGRLRQDKRFDIIDRGLEAVATNEFLLLNLRHAALKERRVRQALAHAIDRDSIQQRALFGLGKAARSHINSGLAWIYTDRFDSYRVRDLARANALLDEAGFARKADGKRFMLRITYDTGKDVEQRAATIIRSNLQEVGIDVVAQPFDRATYVDRTFRQWEFDMALQNFTTGPDPAFSVTPRYHSSQIKRAPFINAMGFANAEVDAILDSEFRIQDRAKRAEAWTRFQEVMMQELPVIPIFEYPNVNAASAKFVDVITTPGGYLENREHAALRG